MLITAAPPPISEEEAKSLNRDLRARLRHLMKSYHSVEGETAGDIANSVWVRVLVRSAFLDAVCYEVRRKYVCTTAERYFLNLLRKQKQRTEGARRNALKLLVNGTAVRYQDVSDARIAVGCGDSCFSVVFAHGIRKIGKSDVRHVEDIAHSAWEKMLDGIGKSDVRHVLLVPQPERQPRFSATVVILAIPSAVSSSGELLSRKPVYRRWSASEACLPRGPPNRARCLQG